MRLFSGWGREDDPNAQHAMTIHLLPETRAWVRERSRDYAIPETLVVESLVISAEQGEPFERGLRQFSRIHREEQGR